MLDNTRLLALTRIVAGVPWNGSGGHGGARCEIRVEFIILQLHGVWCQVVLFPSHLLG